MREVRFRVWDIGGMIKPRKIRIDGTGKVYEKLQNGEWRKLKGYVLEQWTGLKDKNGRDVYEGDILLTDTSWHVIVRWIDESSKDMGNPRCGWSIHRGSWLDKCEVIGNIHEDSELLEEK